MFKTPLKTCLANGFWSHDETSNMSIIFGNLPDRHLDHLVRGNRTSEVILVQKRGKFQESMGYKADILFRVNYIDCEKPYKIGVSEYVRKRETAPYRHVGIYR